VRLASSFVQTVVALRFVDNAVAQGPDAGDLDLDDVAGFHPQRRLARKANAFRRTGDGRAAPLAVPSAGATAGTGAGGGRGRGVVHSGDGPPPAGAVLVVRTLDPGYASVLPGLGGLVAETGSVLSHLAILAREFGVPTVVGVAGAVDRFPTGTVVTVDGATGAVEIQEVAA